MKWVSLHHHTTYSYLDGYGSPEQHMERGAELGISALAGTEHGNVSSHVKLEKAGDKYGVKPIFGCELYTGSVDEDSKSQYKWHLTVLAENEVGYRNLLRLVSRGWAEGFYYEPTVSGEMLAEHKEGLIVLSGCQSSKLSCDLVGGKGVEHHDADINAALRTARRFKSLLGDQFYLEAQAFPELERTRIINQAWLEVGAKLNIPIVATGDIHYPRPADNRMQITLHSIGRGGKNNSFEHQAQSWGYDVSLAPADRLSDKLIIRRMMGTGMSYAQAARTVSVAAEIGQRCNVTLPKMERLRYPTPYGVDSKTLIWRWLRTGWKFRAKRNPHMRKNPDKYVAQLKYEMGLIEDKDYIDYFLMLSDGVRYAKDHGIPVGPARGSAAGSLTVYLLRITEIDPLQYPSMLFERFIDINRNDLPDVDLDFDDERRDEVFEYMKKVWGEECVGIIGSFQRYKGKNSIDDIARVHNIPKYAVEGVKDLLVERSGGDARFDATIEDTLDMFPLAKETFEKYPQLYDTLRLEGNIKGMGIHAAGLVVGSEPLTNAVAVYSRVDGKKRLRQVVSVDKYDAEHLNVLKADFLSLKTMGIIRRAIEAIGMSLDDLYRVPMDDPETIQGFLENDVVEVFQFDGLATRTVNRGVKPDNFQEIADVNALSRPGPLHSGTTQEYIDVKWGRRKATSFHPVVDQITAHTRGQIIYQEQILQLCGDVGGLPWTHRNEIRRIISQKKGEQAMSKLADQFVEGALRLDGMDEETAVAVWKRLVTAGTYAFNSAHAVSYSMLAFWTMWLKRHHPQAFYAAALAKSDPNEKDKLKRLLRDAMKHGIEIGPPDLNHSGINWTPVGTNSVRSGFQQVPGIGEKLAAAVVEDREKNGPFTSWAALERVPGIGPAKMEMIEEFANNDDPFEIRKTQELLDAAREAIRAGKLGTVMVPTHNTAELQETEGTINCVWIGIPTRRNLRDMYEEHRSRTGTELLKEEVKAPELAESMQVFAEDEHDTLAFRINRFDYPRFKGALWRMKLGESVVVVAGTKYGGFGTSISVKRMWVLNA